MKVGHLPIMKIIEKFVLSEHLHLPGTVLSAFHEIAYCQK
jgi:hypothetical protein